MPFSPTDLPAPVAPAISRCGIFSSSVVNTSPVMSLPSAIVSFDFDFLNRSELINSLGKIVSCLRFGTSMPIVERPAIRSMRTDSALSARLRSSVMPATLEYFTPASGLNSKVVTTGPGWTATTASADR